MPDPIDLRWSRTIPLCIGMALAAVIYSGCVALPLRIAYTVSILVVLCLVVQGICIGVAFSTRTGQSRVLHVTLLGLLLVCSMTSIFTQWPLLLRFSLSQRAFEAQLHEQGTVYPRYVGLFNVKTVERPSPGVVRFRLGIEFADYVGFSFRESVESPGLVSRHLSGKWYLERW